MVNVGRGDPHHALIAGVCISPAFSYCKRYELPLITAEKEEVFLTEGHYFKNIHLSWSSVHPWYVMPSSAPRGMSWALSLHGSWDLYPILAQETSAKGVQMINYYFSSEIVSENKQGALVIGNHHSQMWSHLPVIAVPASST